MEPLRIVKVGFKKNGHTRYGRQNWIRPGRKDNRSRPEMAVKARAYRIAHPDKVRAAHKLRIERGRLLLNGLKNAPCTDCGGTYPPECMDFDHVRAVKCFEVNTRTIRFAWARVSAELAKCELVCSNCHRVRTSKRRQGR